MTTATKSPKASRAVKRAKANVRASQSKISFACRYGPFLIHAFETLNAMQTRLDVRTVDSLDLDSVLDEGIADYTFVTRPASDADESSPRKVKVVLGSGKFSRVLLATKRGTQVCCTACQEVATEASLSQYALKHTPLHPHHPLIATRLLREPTILAQLPPHPNLVRVSSRQASRSLCPSSDELPLVRSTKQYGRPDISIWSKRASKAL